MTKVRVYAIGTSTPLESNKSQKGNTRSSLDPHMRSCHSYSSEGPCSLLQRTRHAFGCPSRDDVWSVARVTTLLNSRSHSTELATAAQRSQSPKLKLTVENACCRNGR